MGEIVFMGLKFDDKKEMQRLEKDHDKILSVAEKLVDEINKKEK